MNNSIVRNISYFSKPSKLLPKWSHDNRLYRPIAIGIRPTYPEQGWDKKGYPVHAALGSRLNWEPMAGHLDWDTVGGWHNFKVRIRYAEYEKTRKKSNNSAYAGRVDYKRVPGGSTFAITVCKVNVCHQHANDDYCDRSVYISYPNGSRTCRDIPENQVIETVRLFLSSQYLRHGMALSFGDCDPVEMVQTKMVPRMIIILKRNCS